MLAFAIRRLLGMVLVLFVVSFFVFLVFIVIPGGDPAVRIAGRTANDRTSRTSDRRGASTSRSTCSTWT